MIFNFLGSNHSTSFAWRFLIAKKTPGAEDELRIFDRKVRRAGFLVLPRSGSSD